MGKAVRRGINVFDFGSFALVIGSIGGGAIANSRLGWMRIRGTRIASATPHRSVIRGARPMGVSWIAARTWSGNCGSRRVRYV